MEPLIGALLQFVKAHAALAPVVVCALAFGESLAFISLLVPATVVLVGSGGLIRAAGIGFWPVWGGAVLGAILGDWLSYWLGHHYKGSIGRTWLLSRRPELRKLRVRPANGPSVTERKGTGHAKRPPHPNNPASR